MRKNLIFKIIAFMLIHALFVPDRAVLPIAGRADTAAQNADCLAPQMKMNMEALVNSSLWKLQDSRLPRDVGNDERAAISGEQRLKRIETTGIAAAVSSLLAIVCASIAAVYKYGKAIWAMDGSYIVGIGIVWFIFTVLLGILILAVIHLIMESLREKIKSQKDIADPGNLKPPPNGTSISGLILLIASLIIGVTNSTSPAHVLPPQPPLVLSYELKEVEAEQSDMFLYRHLAEKLSRETGIAEPVAREIMLNPSLRIQYDLAVEVARTIMECASLIGEGRVQRNDFEKVSALIDAILKRCECLPTAWYLKGLALFMENDYTKAERCLNEAIKLRKTYHAVLENEFLKKEFKEFYLRADVYLQMTWEPGKYGKDKRRLYEQALADFKRALGLNPGRQEFWDIQHKISGCLFWLNKTREARSRLDAAIGMITEEDKQLYPDYIAQLFILRAVVRLMLEEPDQAVRGDFDTAEAISPAPEEVRKIRAWYLEGGYKKALREIMNEETQLLLREKFKKQEPAPKQKEQMPRFHPQNKKRGDISRSEVNNTGPFKRIEYLTRQYRGARFVFAPILPFDALSMGLPDGTWKDILVIIMAGITVYYFYWLYKYARTKHGYDPALKQKIKDMISDLRQDKIKKYGEKIVEKFKDLYSRYFQDHFKNKSPAELVFYPASEADVICPLYLLNAKKMIFVDNMPFGTKEDAEASEKHKLKYARMKARFGGINQALVDAIGNLRAPLLWELEWLGAENVNIKEHSEKFFEITFDWAFPNEEPQKRTIYMVSGTDANQVDLYPQKVRDELEAVQDKSNGNLDVFLLKGAFLGVNDPLHGYIYSWLKEDGLFVADQQMFLFSNIENGFKAHEPHASISLPGRVLSLHVYRKINSAKESAAVTDKGLPVLDIKAHTIPAPFSSFISQSV